MIDIGPIEIALIEILLFLIYQLLRVSKRTHRTRKQVKEGLSIEILHKNIESEVKRRRYSTTE